MIPAEAGPPPSGRPSTTSERLRQIQVDSFEPWPDISDPADEDARLLHLLVERARAATRAQFAALNIINREVQRSLIELPWGQATTIPRDHGICAGILCTMSGRQRTFATADARLDPGLRLHPQVTGELGEVRFYAAAAIRETHGLSLGTLCAWSTTPVAFSQAERLARALRPLADTIEGVLGARRINRRAAGARNRPGRGSGPVSTRPSPTLAGDAAL
ncbi:hypothetical protein ACIB24_08240 [Spongisporangium articulatum]|uniref:GAF domain-containing protein n=1 Tax=Spongisporangium articulatum TaxID=3362603 RepID=A0ABW8AM66_9ACTN